MKKIVFLLLASAACSKEPLGVEEHYTAVVQSLAFGREEPAGVAPGFNLDGVKSDERDSRSCAKVDFMDPAGNLGIDNQLATLVPLLDLAGEGAVEGLVQTTINEGRLLVIFDIERYADGNVQLTARRGEDVPLLGTDNRLLPGQTLGLHAEPMLGFADSGRVEGETYVIGPFDVSFPVIVFNLLYDLHLHDAYMRFRLAEDGSLEEGVLGGGALIEDLIGFVRTADMRVGGSLEDLIGGGLRDAADMAREGDVCTMMSMAVTFRAVPAFTF